MLILFAVFLPFTYIYTGILKMLQTIRAIVENRIDFDSALYYNTNFKL